MVDAVFKLLGLLGQLAGMGRRTRKAKFDVLAECYALLETVDEHYRKLFQTAREACPVQQNAGKWTCVQDGATIVLLNDEHVQRAIDRLKADFLKDREESDAQRIQLRTQLSSYLKARMGKEEKRFLWAAAFYLLYPEDPVPFTNLTTIDAEIHVVEWKGGVSMMETPSSRFFEAIERLNDSNEILGVIDDFEQHVKRHWIEVNRYWADLKVTIAAKTTTPG